ncbi:UDP-2,3-diacylglucosamine pyrophosphatase [Georgfuchsia toluolica]|uniref:UDP-2,3-diacylglucosamine hydrolase n=1 Tax=Georgfuchsia toluolica TaxID=424218 RepID=A0A916J7E9_9PROT|nr:UDP-2,3-diacylglucosamine diphosphatase [Georgfuchsia toluolica]CAG4885363.1 UDP-2,3-diacylglucosamine pyrophosphatase [Georgfuchsia toluolica]
MELFLSDLHLHESRPETTQLFLDFIAAPAQGAQCLTILGDLFEYWAGDDDIGTSLHARVCAALKSLASRGTAIRFLAGNRDFLIGAGFATASGAVLLPDLLVEAVAGTPALLLHGDTLCSDDAAYQDYRRQVRNPIFIENFLRRPLAERRAYIEEMRQRSEVEKRGKDMALMDVNADAVRQAFRDANVTRMIHGHTHRLALHRYEIDGKSCERWVLGDWGKTGNFLECDESGWRFRTWDGKQATAIRS